MTQPHIVEIIDWVKEHPGQDFTGDDIARDLPHLVLSNGDKMTPQHIGGVLSNLANDLYAKHITGVRYQRARTYQYNPGQPSKSAGVQRGPSPRKARKQQSPDLLEVVGNLPNGDIVVKCEDGTLRLYREVTA